MNLSAFPRARLTQAPTPLEFLPNLTRLLAGPNLYVKRDDNTGLALGGNKTRKLEFLIGDALAQGQRTSSPRAQPSPTMYGRRSRPPTSTS